MSKQRKTVKIKGNDKLQEAFQVVWDFAKKRVPTFEDINVSESIWFDNETGKITRGFHAVIYLPDTSRVEAHRSEDINSLKNALLEDLKWKSKKHNLA